MYLEIFLADFAAFRVFLRISRDLGKYLNFAGPRPHEISEALLKRCDLLKHLAIKNCEKTFLKNIKEIKLLKKFKNIRRFDFLGRHYQVKKNTVRNVTHQRTEA